MVRNWNEDLIKHIFYFSKCYPGTVETLKKHITNNLNIQQS